MQLIIATKNKKKLKELKKLLGGLPMPIKGLCELDKKIPDIKEDQNAFIGNAKKKALSISKLYKDALVIADDSGLVVKCLKGAPGVSSARYAGPGQNDDKNIAKLLKNMAGKTKREAYFICSAAIAKNGKIVGAAQGRVYGKITYQKHGENGFGYDPVFIPKGYKSTFAKMKPAFKNKISHRAKALIKAKGIIQRFCREHL